MSLSDQIRDAWHGECIPVISLKKFFKELKEELDTHMIEMAVIRKEKVNEIIDKKAGEKLI